MAMNSKGTFWRIAQSWWILLTFTLMFNWLAFFYIAERARHKRCGLWGGLYSIPFIIMVANPFHKDSWQYDFMMTSVWLGCIASIIHGFKVRNEFLMRLEARELASLGKNAMLRHKIEAEYGVKLTVSEPASSQKFADARIRFSETPLAQVVIIDLNNASESELAGLSGVGVILAKKAVQYRQRNNGFRSVDEFFELLRLKPYVIDRIRPLIKVSSLSPMPPQSNGRVVDY